MQHAPLIIYLALCYAAGGMQSITAEEVAGARAPLGRKEWPPVTNGLVFVDGKYIHPPYTVSSVEGDIFINGTPVITALKWPPQVPPTVPPP